jgi:hypothetical protein
VWPALHALSEIARIAANCAHRIAKYHSRSKPHRDLTLQAAVALDASLTFAAPPAAAARVTGLFNISPD